MNTKEKQKRLIAVITTAVYLLVIAYFLIFHNMTVVSAPNLNRPYTIPTDMPVEYAAAMDRQIKEKVEALEKDREDIITWIALATLRKGVSDYVGAEEILLYVTHKNPGGLIAYNNLGNLYASYLNQPKKAEKAFLKVIELDPSYIAGYRNLYDLYRSAYKQNTSAATDILKKGLENNTENIELLMMLGATAIEQKDTVTARGYFERALKQAEVSKNEEIITFIQTQIEKLK